MEVSQVEAHAGGKCVVETAPHQLEGGLQVFRRDALRVKLPWERGVEAVERRVHDLAAKDGVRLGVDRLRVDHPLDEPGGGAVGEPLELGRREDGAPRKGVEDGRAPQAGRPIERLSCALEPSRPAVGGGEGGGARGVLDGETGERP